MAWCRLLETVVFARQNLISDPPFARMNLITCRNLLIYLEPGLQKNIPRAQIARHAVARCIAIDQRLQLFVPFDRKHRIYSRPATITAMLLSLLRSLSDDGLLILLPRRPTVHHSSRAPSGHTHPCTKVPGLARIGAHSPVGSYRWERDSHPGMCRT